MSAEPGRKRAYSVDITCVPENQHGIALRWNSQEIEYCHKHSSQNISTIRTYRERGAYTYKVQTRTKSVRLAGWGTCYWHSHGKSNPLPWWTMQSSFHYECYCSTISNLQTTEAIWYLEETSTCMSCCIAEERSISWSIHGSLLFIIQRQICMVRWDRGWCKRWGLVMPLGGWDQ